MPEQPRRSSARHSPDPSKDKPADGAQDNEDRPDETDAYNGPRDKMTIMPNPGELTDADGPSGHPIHDARRLTDPSGIATIILDDKVYTLRITKAGKLILTK